MSVEAFRADALTLYGGDAPAPHLERLAREGLVFDDAATVTPMARPAAAALMTGIAPDRTLVRDDVADRVPAGTATLAERFGDAGWLTAGFVGSRACGAGSGLDRGFDLLDAPQDVVIGPAQYVPLPRPADEIAARFRSWFPTAPADRCVFAWVHLGDLAVAPFVADAAARPEAYRNALGRVDGAIGVVLDAIESARRAGEVEVIVVGTHGALDPGDDGLGVAYELRPETLRVPLVWRGGRARSLGVAGGRTPAPVWLPDIGAALAQTAGRPLPPDADGRDPFGAEASAGRTRLAWTWATDDQFAWPPRTAAIDAEGEEALDARRARTRALALDADDRRRMERAGVKLGGGKPPAMPQPGVARALVRDVERLRLAIARGDDRTAREIASALAGTHPGNLAVLQHRLWLELGTGRGDEASAIASELLRLYPDHVDALHWAAHARLASGRRTEAAALLEASLSLAPGSADILYDLACVRALSGDREAAIAHLREAVDAGFRTWAWIEQDPDLAAIRSDPRFAEIMRSHAR